MRHLGYLVIVPILVLPSRTTPAITEQAQQIAIPANALIYDAVGKKLYASVGSSAPAAYANSITTIHPTTGEIEKSVFVGSEPGRMVLSDKNKYIYVAVGGMVRRYDIATGTAGPQFGVGSGRRALCMLPVPGDPEALVVARGSHDDGGTAIYKNGQALPSVVNIGPHLAPAVLPDMLYSYESRISHFTLSAARLTPDGVKAVWGQGYLFVGNVGVIGGNGLLINTSGTVLDPEARQQIGQLPGTGPEAALLDDPSRGVVYQLHHGRIVTYSLRTYTQIGELEIPRLTDGGYLTVLGNAGFAFAAQRQVVLVRTTLPPLLTPIDLALTRTQLDDLPLPNGRMKYQLTVQNLSPASSSAAYVTDLLPEGAKATTLVASQGTVNVDGRVIKADLGSIRPSGKAFVQVTVQQEKPGALGFTAIARGFEPDPQPGNNIALYQSPTPVPAPAPTPPAAPELSDLSAAWQALDQAVVGAGVNLKATIEGAVIVRNTGRRASSPTRIRFYLSRRPDYDPAGSRLLQEAPVPALLPGKSARVILKAPLGLGEEASGLFVVTGIDPSDMIREGDEKNNSTARRIP